jgi:hypothetical protein
MYLEEAIGPNMRLPRRTAQSDKWLNSGGIKGSTTIWLTDSVGLRKRYGKFESAHTACKGWRSKFKAFTLLTGSHAEPVEDKATVVFVSFLAEPIIRSRYVFLSH